MSTSLNATFSEAELQVFETMLDKLATVYSGWILEELRSDHPCGDACAYLKSKLAAVQSVLGDVQIFRWR